MEAVLIDTDIAIDYLRGLPYAKKFVEYLWLNDSAFLSVISIYELLAGMKENEKIATESFISACSTNIVTAEIAVRAGELYRHYRTKGVTLTTTDCLIYATAIVRGYKIATRNTKHYPDGDIIIPVDK
ncbi:MAG: type II toxin-antitoxin system VapC family toxin [Nitrospirae bacterium]|uniref:type II toxin-antitoxin system VapC family toxin n=1 Tax=Candidatus Magnetobacterium casense TaxID=1455061 RepID=UPI000696FC43|nr:type II toxin-antitoxin system VapC family toxin [Candidatus Magnetobacterium casensis]MBF0336882.1 type II toxin-antitoxin system VapC family toxin [Nitrospirota bacterium]